MRRSLVRTPSASAEGRLPHFSSTALTAKRADLSSASELARAVFSSVLGAYGAPADEGQVERELAALDRSYGGHRNSRYTGSDARRFAGDASLPRQRYASLVSRDFDSDRLMLRELSAYLIASAYPGLVSLFDSGVMNSLELAGVLGEISTRNERVLDLSTSSLLIAVRPLGEDPLLTEAFGAAGHYVVQIPYRVDETSETDVLDLRRPEARRWLVEAYNGRFALPRRGLSLRSKQVPFVLHRPPLEDFTELLPSLLTQWLGAGWTTGNLTGLFARWAGARALVYPSARDDAWVQVVDGEVRDSSGWCTVSYADAPAPSTVAAVSQATDPWPSQVGWEPLHFTSVDRFIPLQGTSIDHVLAGPERGSFSVSGVREQNRAAYRLAQVCTLVEAVDEQAGRRLSGLLRTAALTSTADDTTWMSGVVLRALVDDEAAVEQLVPRATTDLARELVAAARRVVRQVPTGFRTAGSYRTSLPLWA